MDFPNLNGKNGIPKNYNGKKRNLEKNKMEIGKK